VGVNAGEILAFVVPLLALAGSWAVVKYQSSSHEGRVKNVEDETQALKIEVAVLKSKQEDHGSRMDQFVSALEAMEDRIIARMTQLFEAIKRNG